MNQRNLSLAINKLLDAKQDIGDFLSEDPALVAITEDHMSDAIDNLIGELYRASKEAFELRLTPPLLACGCYGRCTSHNDMFISSVLGAKTP